MNFSAKLSLIGEFCFWYDQCMPNPTAAELKNRYKAAKKVLNKAFPEATTALNYKNPFELLIATIMSAQCTDVLVNKVTATLFKKYKSPADFAKANLTTLTKDIYPVTFYRNKAKSIKKTAQIIEKRYNGNVPRTLEQLIELPGVARKTANVVLGHAYNIPSGFVVDTHVKRVTKRLGLTKNEDPKKVEQDLIKIVPKEDWVKFADQLILFGRKYCTARNDKCEINGIKLIHY
ncbi:MAG: Endonuclease [Candidatus Doudnabacteria bacterium]|nr:Endonuclease [Candidatus Doudnabacteria bacterium]